VPLIQPQQQRRPPSSRTRRPSLCSLCLKLTRPRLLSRRQTKAVAVADAHVAALSFAPRGPVLITGPVGTNYATGTLSARREKTVKNERFKPAILASRAKLYSKFMYIFIFIYV
jgi:hypothetical protein